MRSAPIKTTAVFATHDQIEDMMMTYRMIEHRLMRWA
jgi:ABC-type sugar transport system ATPase subunit